MQFLHFAKRMSRNKLQRLTSLRCKWSKVIFLKFNASFRFRIVFTVLIILVVSSTFYDLYTKKSNCELNFNFILLKLNLKLYSISVLQSELLKTFSIYTNAKSLFEIKKSKSSDAVNCLHGIRALSICWIILGHRFVLQWLLAISNLSTYHAWQGKLHSIYFNLHVIAVDSFLFMGGFLVVWSGMKSIEQ